MVRKRRFARREVSEIQSLVSSPDCGANKSVSPTPIPKPISKPSTVCAFGIVFPFASRSVRRGAGVLPDGGRFRGALCRFDGPLSFSAGVVLGQELSQVDPDEVCIHLRLRVMGALAAAWEQEEPATPGQNRPEYNALSIRHEL